jgi:hypothetical protein
MDSVLYGIAVTFLLILAILWFCLPFAVFGTQPRLDELITQAKETNRLLTEIREEMKLVGAAARHLTRTE